MRTAAAIWLLTLAATLEAAELTPQTSAAWDRYVELTEERIARELDSREGFLVQDFLPEDERRRASRVLDEGLVFTTKLRTIDEDGGEVEVPDGMVHHWLGSVLVPGAEVDRLVLWLQDYDEHERYFDEVEESRLVARRGESFEIFLRLRRKKVVTVHYSTEHSVSYRRHGPGRLSSSSRATRIAELEGAGTPSEREKAAGDDRGFLWRLHSYWRFRQVPRGVIVECESISLSRGIPFALRWLVGRYLDSVPRESLESTLLPIRKGPRSLEASAGPAIRD